MEANVNQTLDEIGPTKASHPKRVTAEMLSKIWTIQHEMVEKTLRVTSQLNRQGENNSLARNLGKNDRMLIYRKIKSHFSLTPFCHRQGEKHTGLHVQAYFCL